MPRRKTETDQIRCALADEKAGVCTSPVNRTLPLCRAHLEDLERTMKRILEADHLRKSMTEKGGDAFLFNRKSGAVYALNTTGAFIVKEIMSGKDPAAIIEDMHQTFVTDSWIEIVKDIFAFLREVQKTDLIAPSDSNEFE